MECCVEIVGGKVWSVVWRLGVRYGVLCGDSWG